MNLPKKVIILGSGGLSIGQAGEFDYSGSQAIKALREEGIEVIIINPNIATVQTNSQPGVKVYLYPVEPEWVENVIRTEKPDGIIAGFGGQTALNCILKLDEAGILNKYQVQNLGSSPETLRTTEDRKQFAEKMKSINMPVLQSEAVSNLKDASETAKKIGYPVIVRAAYALGGLGSGFANNETELNSLVENALKHSNPVLIEKSLRGWKELEYEVMRDSHDHVITICNMENIDPLGVHTGDSIVVAPSQTLSDSEYQLLRNSSLKIVRSLGIVGECNVQFALDPNSLEYYVIEVNARLSRSSALASKASGYPIAFIAAKVVLGFSLLDLKNPVTGITSAFYEPSMDYITVKIPRWDMEKFQGTNRNLGSAMKSVGEIMSIGKTFHEALQKALRMVTEKPDGLLLPYFNKTSADELKTLIATPTDQRMLALYQSFRKGIPLATISKLTSIDPWFLTRIQEIASTETEIAQNKDLKMISQETWLKWKRLGFGDDQIGLLTSNKPSEVRKHRISKDVKPYAKKIDTTSAEYPSPSSYLYMSYFATSHDELPELKSENTAVILGGGAYRVGSSVEFDWCAVATSSHLQKEGWKTIMINCNPETVSTDYNSSDRLYFEELSVERILDIAEFENSKSIIVSVGGQLPNQLAQQLADAGLKLLGHGIDAISSAENRNRFSQILDEIHVKQPPWISAQSKGDIQHFTEKNKFPLIIRPSYVLSGAAMNVAWNPDSLEQHLKQAQTVSRDYPVVVSKFIEGAVEVEVDGVASKGEILAAAVSEHVEHAGVHSGDATLVYPTQHLPTETKQKIKGISNQIVQKLMLNGPFNIQYMVDNGNILVIECNARSSRSFPFVSKVSGHNLSELAALMMTGKDNEKTKEAKTDPWLDHTPKNRIGVKAAMFSFNRLDGVDPISGVEMLSTGEVGCMASSFEESLLLALEASGIRPPRKGVLISAGPKGEKLKILPTLSYFKESGIQIFATSGTAAFLNSHGYESKIVAWPGETKEDVIHAIRNGSVDFVINIPKSLDQEELQHSAVIRKAAVRYGRTLMTDLEKAAAYIDALKKHPQLPKTHRPVSI